MISPFRLRVVQALIVACVIILSIGAAYRGTDIVVTPGPNAITNAILSAKPGDRILVAYGTYNERVFLYKSGLTLEGVPDDQGRKPVIDGTGVLFDPRYPIRSGYNRDFFNANAVLLVGPSQTSPWGTVPDGITVKDMDVTGGKNLVYVWGSTHFTLNHCWVHDANGNGIFVSGNGKNQYVSILNNGIKGNGVAGSWFQHQVYSEAKIITYRGNHIWAPRSGMLGAALKDRSGDPDYDDPKSPDYRVPGTTIEDNDIEEGAFGLDLVDPQETARRAPSDPLGVIPFCHETVVRRNRFRETNAGGSKLCHFGDDQASAYADPATRLHPERSRRHLTAADNVVVINRDARIGRYFVLFQASSNDQRIDCTNLSLNVTAQTPGLAAPSADWLLDYGTILYAGLVSNVPVQKSVRLVPGATVGAIQ